MHAHMEAQDADFHEGSIALGQLGGRPVGVLARHEGHVSKQPWVAGAWQMRQSLRPPMYAICCPACAPALCVMAIVCRIFQSHLV